MICLRELEFHSAKLKICDFLGGGGGRKISRRFESYFETTRSSRGHITEYMSSAVPL